MSEKRPWPTPWPEAWITLAALGARVPRVRLGTLVTGNTYRHPAVLAKMAATLDHITGGRVVLGLGELVSLGVVVIAIGALWGYHQSGIDLQAIAIEVFAPFYTALMAITFFHFKTTIAIGIKF